MADDWHEFDAAVSSGEWAAAHARAAASPAVRRGRLARLEAQRWFCGAPEGAPPDLRWACDAAGAEEVDVRDLGWLAIHAAHAALLTLSRFDAEPWLELLRARSRAAESRLFIQAVSAWAGVWSTDGSVATFDDTGGEHSTLARRLGLAGLPTQMHLTAALASLASRSEVAVPEARAAARMARTERRVVDEVLAALVLARTRRYAGVPHLAGHIARSVARVASARFARWLSWELAMCGAHREGDDLESDLGLLLAAEARGDRESFGRAADRIAELERECAPLCAEASAVRALLAGPQSARYEHAATAWQTMAEESPPAHLRGLCRPVERGQLGAWVCARGDATWRVVGSGECLLQGVSAPRVLAPEAPPQRRTDGAIAWLLQARSASIEAFVRGVYGVRYEPAIHRSVVNMLVHRARGRLGELAAIERVGDRIELHLGGDLLLWEPRAPAELDDELLHLIAMYPGRPAGELAVLAGVSLRSVQSVLADLVRDGCVERLRDGRHASYQLSDTTFSTPTENSARWSSPAPAT